MAGGPAQLRERLDQPVGLRGVAVGVASSSLTSGPVSREQLLSWADEAQYAAKAAGSTQPVVAGRDAVLRPERRRWRGRC